MEDEQSRTEQPLEPTGEPIGESTSGLTSEPIDAPTSEPTSWEPPANRKKNNRIIIILSIVLVAVILIIGGVFMAAAIGFIVYSNKRFRADLEDAKLKEEVSAEAVADGIAEDSELSENETA